MKIFKYLIKYWYAIIAVLLLLIVQASSDLSLPSLTSDIVDVGIQQGGLEQSTPDKIRKSTLQGIEIFMTEKEKQTIQDNYKEATQTVDGKKVDIYKLDLQKGMTKEKLADIFNLPMMMIASTQSKDVDNAKEAKGVMEDYQAIAKDAAQAQALGKEAKTLGEQAQAAGQAAATATDGATAAAKLSRTGTSQRCGGTETWRCDQS